MPTRGAFHLAFGGALIALAGALVAFTPGVVHATAPTPASTTQVGRTATSQAPAEGDRGRVILVLDSSGSMKEPASGGQTKIEAAKSALREVVDELPDEQEVGLRVYGAEVFNADDPGACTDSQLVVEPDTENRKDLNRAIDDYRPFGETPTGYALQEAGKDLGSEGNRNIILVSDGEPTCEPDPCEVARELTRNGVGVRIDVVGLDVNDAARKDLQCVAAAGKGTYYDVDSSEELADSLTRVARRAARPYATIGEQVIGTASPQDAPEITPGDWLDTGEAASRQKYYRLQRTLQNSTIFTSVAYRTSRRGSDFVDVELKTPEGDSCDFSTSVGSNNKLVSEAAVVSTYDGSEDPCLSSEELILGVKYRGTAKSAPLEIRATELPEVINAEELEKAESPTSWARPAKGNRVEVTGGTSFGDAEQVETGSYNGSIVPGETLTFTVEAGWGQQLDAIAHYPALKGKAAEATAGVPHTILDVYAPSRAPAEARLVDASIQNDRLLLTNGSTEAAVTTGTISYANLDTTADFGAAESGTYTVALYLQDTEENSSIPVPFELDLAVTGDPTDGPAFEEIPIAGQASPSATASPAPEPSADDGGTGSPDDSAISPASLALGGLGLMALLGAGVLFLRKRRAV